MQSQAVSNLTASRMIREMLSRALGDYSRSGALKPYVMLIGIFVSASIPLAFIGLPPWVVLTPLGLCLPILYKFFQAFDHLLKTNPDALRSEKFQIEKMQIERGVSGDSVSGLANGPSLPAKGKDENGV